MDRDVDLVTESLGPLPEPGARPLLVMLVGLPGSGKTYFARCLRERVPLAVVESDAVRRQLIPRPTYSLEESSRVFSVCHRLLERLLASGMPVLFDATSLAERYREPVYRVADRAGARLILVRMVAPRAVVRQRLEERAAHPAADEFSEADWVIHERMRFVWQAISRPHYVVDSGKDIEPALARIVRAIRHHK